MPITHRKDQPGPLTNSGQGLRLTPFSSEAVWDRRNRIRPKSPKIPFAAGDFGTAEPFTGDPAAEQHHGKRRLFAFFRSRRKGRYRIINFILLPLAILLTAAALVYILKFL
ncbi:MAG: hypothetical protein ACOYM3_27800 [Terrimicrobiaceae bacterium]